MSRNQPEPKFDAVRALQKFAVSGFVICSFTAYALHEHFATPNRAVSALAQAQSAGQSIVNPTSKPNPPEGQSGVAPTAVPTAPPPPTNAPQVVPTAVPSPTNPPSQQAQGQLKNGSYTGPQVDAFYGIVQIKAVVQNGKLTDVQFLQYPNDRRTSVRINTIAIPYLQQEAIQAQSANVDIISGATLTSEAFQQSLQVALQQAGS